MTTATTTTVPDGLTEMALEYAPPEVQAAAQAKTKADAKRAAKQERRRFDADALFIDAIWADSIGDIRIRDAAVDGDYVTATNADEADRIAAEMAQPMLSLITTADEVIGVTSITADPNTATVSITQGDIATPLWVPVVPFPQNWIGESNAP